MNATNAMEACRMSRRRMCVLGLVAARALPFSPAVPPLTAYEYYGFARTCAGEASPGRPAVEAVLLRPRPLPHDSPPRPRRATGLSPAASAVSPPFLGVPGGVRAASFSGATTSVSRLVASAVPAMLLFAHSVWGHKCLGHVRTGAASSRRHAVGQAPVPARRLRYQLTDGRR